MTGAYATSLGIGGPLLGKLVDPGAVRCAYAADASASELTWIAGPPLALGLGAAWSTGAALAVAGLTLVLVALAVGHLALTAAAGNVLALAAVLLAMLRSGTLPAPSSALAPAAA